MPISARSFFATVSLVLMTSPALAGGVGIYAYESRANFCPAGLQPVSLNGVICCGTPNQEQTYQQTMRHPVTRVTHRVRSARAHLSCPAGVKGCN
ncbi:hypothetical protein RA2_00317 [Roseovarius sp. A-2]|uniref:hypothetical protein n=1 Tax=Roseovarius sp. A-2 TaxID=1570360 RepID=UPI0009B542B7|nr:hypothetical protein [Roseovarius sp. A-2]GAW33281.1 hypothetical protein RA2_00317 [Roseovarius sp. A-2]